ncbi:hypothetical protein N7510_002671 [Penicillium lagena]|uniref:uncharacterized protein n=1 Tax=Penicillium lagena TaxID=94218 RepID=UPI0025423E95|nr:uncharacterized protein N7510_002671 [Penicillium lagena]KAJ5626362.1 hypothetical protein N7510_002671 [Penicillium lagena]
MNLLAVDGSARALQSDTKKFKLSLPFVNSVDGEKEKRSNQPLHAAMDPNPVRVLVIVSQRSSRWKKVQNRAEDIVPSAMRLLQNKNLGNGFHATVSDAKLLAVQKWRTRTFIVFDICNTAYDAKLGHLPEQNQLP